MISEKLLPTSNAYPGSHPEGNTPAFPRTWTETFFQSSVIAFPRTLTETAFSIIDFESDEAWTKRLLDDYREYDTKGPEGDVPIPEGFGRTKAFWQKVAFAIFFGAVVGVASIAVVNATDTIPQLWMNNGDFDTPDDFDFYAGKKHWMLITTCAGFAVGLLRYLTKYPENVPGFFKEVRNGHVDPNTVPVTLLASLISLSAGASLGPEQCMGNFGGGLGTLVCEHFGIPEGDDSKLIVFSGMSAALGALFPSPWLGVMIIHELSDGPPKSYMESTTIMSVSAIISFAVFYSIAEHAYLDHLQFSYGLSESWKFDMWNCFTGFAIGIISAGICLMQIIFIGITKQIFTRIRQRCDSIGRVPGIIVTTTIGGLIIGIMAWALPGTVGDGNMVTGSIIQFSLPSAPVKLTEKLLISTAVGKMFTLAVSMNCGMIGGIIFPLVTIAIIAASVAFHQHPEVPLALYIGCFMAGIPAAICPMPFTLIGLPVVLYFFGLTQTAPIFISAITSYMVICGSGLFAAIASRQQQNQQNNTDDKKSVVGADESFLDKSAYTYKNTRHITT